MISEYFPESHSLAKNLLILQNKCVELAELARSVGSLFGSPFFHVWELKIDTHGPQPWLDEPNGDMAPSSAIDDLFRQMLGGQWQWHRIRSSGKLRFIEVVHIVSNTHSSCRRGFRVAPVGVTHKRFCLQSWFARNNAFECPPLAIQWANSSNISTRPCPLPCKEGHLGGGFLN